MAVNSRSWHGLGTRCKWVKQKINRESGEETPSTVVMWKTESYEEHIQDAISPP